MTGVQADPTAVQPTADPNAAPTAALQPEAEPAAVQPIADPDAPMPGVQADPTAVQPTADPNAAPAPALQPGAVPAVQSAAVQPTDPVAPTTGVKLMQHQHCSRTLCSRRPTVLRSKRQPCSQTHQSLRGLLWRWQ